MTSSGAPKSSVTGTAKGKGSSKAKNAKSSPPPLKVVVRRLPHQMNEEEFLTVLKVTATDAGMGERGGSWDLLYFIPGKISKKRGTVTGVAYLHIDRGRGVTADLILIKLRAAVLASEAMVVATKDSKPSEKTTIGPVVEAAPFQKLFKQKPKRDVRVGTIGKDTDYKAFCAALQSPAPPLPGADVQADIRESEGKEEPKPQNALLDFLKERGAKKMRDSQRAAALGSASSVRGSRRVSSSTASSASTTSAEAMVAAGTSAAKTTKAVALSPSPIKRQGTTSPSSSLTTSRATVVDPAKVKKATDKEAALRGQNKTSNISSRAPPRGSTSVSRPPPSPTSGAHKAAETRSASKGSGRTTSRSGKTPAVPTPATAAAAQPSTVLSKGRPSKTKVAAVALSAANYSPSPRSGGGGGRRGRSGGKMSNSSRSKGGGGASNGGGGS